MTKPCLYKATNLVNGKIYIGVCKHGLDHRRPQHERDARKEKPTMKIHRAIKKYGAVAFKWEVMAEFDSHNDALTAEIKAIEDLKPEYNTAAGGRQLVIRERWPEWIEKVRIANTGKKRSPEIIERMRSADRSNVFKKIICLNDGLVFDSVKIAGAHYGIHANRISASLKQKEISTKWFIFAYFREALTEEKRKALFKDRQDRWLEAKTSFGKRVSRRVRCKNTGTIFGSCKEASDFFGISKQMVILICREKAKSSRGVELEYIDPPIYNMGRKNKALYKTGGGRSKKVICLDDGVIYESATAAAKANGVARSLISQVCLKNPRKHTAAGKKFEYVESAK